MRFYFKTEIEANVLGSWIHEHILPQKYQALKRLQGIIDREKVNFYRLVACYWIFNWTVKGLSTLNKTKQNKKNNYKPSPPLGISPPLAFFVWGAGLMLALIFVTPSVNGNELKICHGIKKSWPPTWTRPVLRLSLINWLKQVSF